MDITKFFTQLNSKNRELNDQSNNGDEAKRLREGSQGSETVKLYEKSTKSNEGNDRFNKIYINKPN